MPNFNRSQSSSVRGPIDILVTDRAEKALENWRKLIGECAFRHMIAVVISTLVLLAQDTHPGAALKTRVRSSVDQDRRRIAPYATFALRNQAARRGKALVARSANQPYPILRDLGSGHT